MQQNISKITVLAGAVLLLLPCRSSYHEWFFTIGAKIVIISTDAAACEVYINTYRHIHTCNLQPALSKRTRSILQISVTGAQITNIIEKINFYLVILFLNSINFITWNGKDVPQITQVVAHKYSIQLINNTKNPKIKNGEGVWRNSFASLILKHFRSQWNGRRKREANQNIIDLCT